MVLNQTIEQKQTIQNEEIISTYVQIALGTYPEVERSGGMILTQEDVINIKLYVKYGFALPEILAEVKSYLGYDAIGIAGLEPKDIQELFRGIKTNVSKWNGIEAAILTQSRELETFSSNIILVGDEIIQYIDEMPVTERMKKKIEEIGVIPPGMLFDFDPTDNEIATELVVWLADLKSEVETRKTDALSLKNKITDFKEEIGNILQPSLSRKIGLIKDNKLDEQIQDLAQQIEDKRKEIEQLEKDYDKYVGLAFSGLAGGLIGVAITGGIYGSKAEEARKNKNKAVAEKKSIN
ncbi:alpha-xenorhabdolysin family binary toxin subunit A [Nostoc sp. CENA67]|uniref:Alpha-xenorhabdolysin family binary toxin subunit A n=1 Tax=Amazonocrinis nigriterrae CENA67 TaxID=2794033 RepID=A0A8J7I0F1_9NOST|nr:alpha-xenorhabdolysin family binary toxin subunit A [Amazonocrinis nigriterrae]MBH8565889.1 alpha-xenorhabdolysin family binary toxin subunit A [Amazonocrinis nigriterrae CENA67]